MTPYHAYFVPIFLSGCLLAAIVSVIAGRLSGCFVSGILLVIGIMSFWAGIFLGTEMGYRAWQSMPNPPDEAFSDTSAVGALVLGWIPGVIYCVTIFGLVRGFCWLLHWANPDKFPNAVASNSKPIETGNPYQGPNSS